MYFFIGVEVKPNCLHHFAHHLHKTNDTTLIEEATTQGKKHGVGHLLLTHQCTHLSMREIVEKNKPKTSPPNKKLHDYFFTALRL
jgi:hypothetical protein